VAEVGVLEPCEAAWMGHPKAKGDVLVAARTSRSSPAEEGMTSEVTAHDVAEVMEVAVSGPASS
jgi:hypothetical protein